MKLQKKGTMADGNNLSCISQKLYMIPLCLRREVNNNPTLPPAVHMVVTFCTTCSKKLNSQWNLFYLYTLTTSL